MLIQVIIRLIVYTDQLVSRPNDLEESSSVQTQNHGIDNTVSCKRGFLSIFQWKISNVYSKDFFYFAVLTKRRQENFFTLFSM